MDKQFNLLTIKKQFRYKNEGFTMKQNLGLDTETYKGYAKLICCSDANYAFLENFSDVVKFLTQNKFRNKFNWFYNVRFDFEALIKYLDYGDLINLYNDKLTQFDDVIISYIPKKFFMITDSNNHRYRFYDMYNFLDTSLNNASKKFLHDEKLSIVDSSQLNTNLKYWEDNKDIIVKYCIKDAQLTKNLADYFWNIVYKNMEYYPKLPYSKGRIAEEYFLSKCYIPTINKLLEENKKVLEYGYNAYYGGRFELLQRGYQENVYSYDISSAYPAQMTELIDYNKGKWVKTTKVNLDAYSGFYKCICECNDAYFSPFVQKVNALSVYPNGKMVMYLAKSEIDFIREHFDNATIKIVSGYEFYEKELVYPLKSEIEHLYKWKENEPDENIKYCVKIFMNSFYGKLIQRAGDDNATGKVFNPLWAAEITASARIKILKLGLQKPDCVIMFSTDSVHSTEPLSIKNNPTLGDFKKDFEGSGVYIMSDVYNLWNDKKQKSKIRGFSVALEKDRNDTEVLLKDILLTSDEWKDKTKYQYATKRVYHLGECILHNKSRKIEDMNMFDDVVKTVDINGDKKRLWDKEFSSGKDALKNTILSMPLGVR